MHANWKVSDCGIAIAHPTHCTTSASPVAKMMAELGPVSSTGCPESWLERTPLSWLHQFIGSLPSKERLALFQCSIGMARQVMQSTPCHQLHPQTAGNSYIRNDILHHMLGGGHLNIQPRVWLKLSKPFSLRGAFAASITHLNIRCDTDPHTFKWDELIDLKQLTLHWYTPYLYNFLTGLCDAFKAGQLPRLEQLEILFPAQDPHSKGSQPGSVARLREVLAHSSCTYVTN